MGKYEITDHEFEQFAQYFYSNTGIRFEKSKRYFVDKRLVDRIEKTGQGNFHSYFRMLRYERVPGELEHLTNLMTVNETYFFREEYQFKCMVEELLPNIIKTKKRGERIRIWSIPSSTGEEPYSIAIYLLEYWKGIDEWDVEIISSDIDTAVLKSAENGIFGERSIANIPTDLRQKYFNRVSPLRYQISLDIRKSITFTRFNLSKPVEDSRYRNIDIIFCRNLLIYFDNKSREHAAKFFYTALRENGYVCLGHSESMARISALFKTRQLKNAIVYHKSVEH